MKKSVLKIVVPILAVILLLIILPIPKGTLDDGGTREYRGLFYTAVSWNRITADSVYNETKIYFPPNNTKDIDELWELESENVEQEFEAKIIAYSENSVTVSPLPEEPEAASADKICISRKNLADIGATAGDIVIVRYKGGIRETYPAQVTATGWERKRFDDRTVEYPNEWLNKETAEKLEYQPFDAITITEIYKDCFLAKTVIPMPYTIKLNGSLDEKWCIGDKITVTYDEVYYDDELDRIEADFHSVEESHFVLEPDVAYKPVIYLYPEEETAVSANLTLKGKLLCTYPRYENGWRVTARPNGTLKDKDGKEYNYLYWEGELETQYNMAEGFCVKGSQTAEFLETALEKLGLTRREANEFIVFWLPLMEQNEYNIISFQNEEYTSAAELNINPAPDTVIRVFMAWQPAAEYKQIPPQELSAPERNGFTVVEWGGAKIS